MSWAKTVMKRIKHRTVQEIHQRTVLRITHRTVHRILQGIVQKILQGIHQKIPQETVHVSWYLADYIKASKGYEAFRCLYV